MTIGILHVRISFIGKIRYLTVLLNIQSTKVMVQQSETLQMLKAVRREARRNEIETFGKLISMRRNIYINRKKYNRKKEKGNYYE
jgi:hypothetical protein